MKKSLIIALSYFSLISVPAIDGTFFYALHQIESSGRTGEIIGDNGKALGPYQIHKVYFLDAAEFDKSLGNNYNNVTNIDFARRVVIAYLNRYNKTAVNNKNYEILARMHNGGPKGHTRQATLSYWEKFRRYLKK